MYDDILVPTDGSDAAEVAIDEAVSLAALTGARLHGLYVVDSRDYATLPETKWVELAAELESAGEDAVLAVERAAESAGVEVTTTIQRGPPHEAILQYVEREGVDLVVMGTHGRSGLGRVLLGSVAESVVRRSPVPVHVVRMEADADASC